MSKRLALIFAACTILCIAGAFYYPPKIIKPLRDMIVYRIPFPVSGLPACPDCNIVLINLDTLRPGNMGCYGYTRDTTPHICEYANRNMLFTQFYTQTSFTLDSHASIFTGLYPTTHHMITALRDALNPDIPVLADTLNTNGYRTIWAGMTNDINLPLHNGFERGFSEIHNLYEQDPGWQEKYKKILPALDGDKPAFIFFHSYAPHAPYLPGGERWRFSERKFPWIPVTPDELYKPSFEFYRYVLLKFQNRLSESSSEASRSRNRDIIMKISDALSRQNLNDANTLFWALPEYEQFDMNIGWYWKKIDPKNPDVVSYMKDIYDEKIYQVDQNMKYMLDFFERPEIKRKTIVVILSDNGEDFGEHGEFDHGWNIYNSGTHAPFIVAVPKMKQGVYRELVAAIDIFPTLLDLVGINRSHIPLEGNSLVSVMSGRGESQVGERYIISQHRGTDITAIRNTRWKMYKNNTVDRKFIELYDLMTDPDEQHNVLGDHLDIARHLDTVLTHMLDISPKYASVSGSFPDWVDEEKRKTLLKEGYF